MSSIILYSPPGGGKTTMACSMTKLGHKILIYDADQKAKKMINIQEGIEQGLIEVYSPKSPLIQDGALKSRVLMPKQPPLKQPQGYLEFVEWLTQLQVNPPPDFDNLVLVIDSATMLFSHLKRLVLHVSGRGQMEIQDWGIILSNLEELFMTFFSLPCKHQILICHDQTERDELIGRVEIKPLIDGQMKNKVGAYVEEMYYLQPEGQKDQVKYLCYTKPQGRVQQVRTSRPLPAIGPADFSLLWPK